MSHRKSSGCLKFAEIIELDILKNIAASSLLLDASHVYRTILFQYSKRVLHGLELFNSDFVMFLRLQYFNFCFYTSWL